MRRFKLVRIVDGGRYVSANTTDESMLEYKVGEVTSAPQKGVACYKQLRYAVSPHHTRETSGFFNGGRPVAILEVEPIGKSIPKVDPRYHQGGAYEGGINYPAVRVVQVVTVIDSIPWEDSDEDW